MRKNKKWILGYKMLDMEKPDRDYIQKSVRNKLEKQKGEIIMIKRKLKPLIITAAAIVTSLASLTIVNAATDGAVTEKINEAVEYITVKINGKEMEAKGHIVSEDDSTIIYEFEIDDSDAENGIIIEDSYVFDEESGFDYNY